MKNTSFIRDLLVKLLLLVIFVFLLMKLFPVPNLTPFYDKIFNENIQTMKDAAKDYYTTERMPKKEGKSSKMTLQEMIDNKLIIPFVDKNGEECDTEKSYVKVTKKGDEYELKVSLTCGKESNYIIDKIGCYNFCPTGSCAEAKEVKTETSKDGKISVVNPNGRYETEYEFVKKVTSEDWKLGDWTTEKLSENENRKLVDTKTQYTGQKKVTSGTKLYEQVKYGYKTEYTYDTQWRDEKSTDENAILWKERTLYTGQKKVDNKTTLYEEIKYGYKTEYTYDTVWRNTKVTDEDAILWKKRTLYTGQKKVEAGQTLYEHVKYGQVDQWTYDTDWTTEVKTTSDNLKLWKERTLYTGQKKIENTTTNYKHVKYGDTYKWTETGWTTANRKETDDIKVIGKRFTVKKDIYENICENFVVDDNWYSSVPANTTSRIYDPKPYATKTESGWSVLYNSYKSYTTLPTYSGDRKYEFLYSEETTCTSNCNGQSKVRVYYYRVYTKTTLSTVYQFRYCVPKTRFVKTDTQVVTDLQSYLSQGYTLVQTEYNYNVRTTYRGIVDTKWTTSITPPSGYTYTGQSSKTTNVSYQQLDKWVGSKEDLGEYTYNIQTVKQYKYAYNNPKKYVEDYKWTSSKTSPSGYEFTGRTSTNKTVTYEQLDKWVGSKEALGEYTYNIQTVTQYKYKYKHIKKFVEDIKWITVKKADEGYELTGNTKETTKTTYIDLGKWVESKEALGEYTYNIKTKKQYKYKYKHIKKYIESTIWTTENVAEEGYELTGKTKETTKTSYIDLGRWVDSKSELEDYTYNIKTRTLYRYKTRTTNTSESYIWAKTNPGNGYEPTGRSRRKFIPNSGNVQK